MLQPAFRPKQDGPFGTLERPACSVIRFLLQANFDQLRHELGRLELAFAICRQFLVLCGANGALRGRLWWREDRREIRCCRFAVLECYGFSLIRLRREATRRT